MSWRSKIIATLVLFASYAPARATSIASVALDALYREADVVALIAVTGADSVAFEDAVYRADVVQGFKGVQKGTTIYFRPYSTYRLGGEYISFLRRSGKILGNFLKPVQNPWPSAVNDSYLRIMYAGYSVLPVEYTCVIP